MESTTSAAAEISLRSLERSTTSSTGSSSDLLVSSEQGKEVEYTPAVLTPDGQQRGVAKMGEPSMKLDKYGFILNVDSNGRIYEVATKGEGEEEEGKVVLVVEEEEQQQQGQENKKNNKKGDDNDDDRKQKVAQAKQQLKDARKNDKQEQSLRAQLELWDKDKKRTKKLIKCLRKGIPESSQMRGKVWVSLAGQIDVPGLYEEIVHKTSDAMLASYKEEIREGGRGGGVSSSSKEEKSAQTSPTASDSSFAASAVPATPKSQQERKSK